MSLKIVLKPGRERSVRQRHPWIFSGAVLECPSVAPGTLLSVYSADGKWLCWASINPKSNIIGRIWSFSPEDPLLTLRAQIKQAIQRRKPWIGEKTSAYRCINGEGDFLPGLIVDHYAGHLTVQISSAGMEKERELIIHELKELLNPLSIYEKSQQPSRQEEGLEPFTGQLFGVTPEEVVIEENGLQFIVDIKEGQKTGFFLDQRLMRQWVGSVSKGKRVLNCFSYTGGFSLAAAAGGAVQVDSVDISKRVVELGRKNLAAYPHCQFFEEDVFTFLRERSLNYDLVILDPPAFVKRRKDLVQGCRGYKEINRLAMKKVPTNSLLVTSSCSLFVDPKLFQQVVFQAGVEANRPIQIIGRHLQAPDHPVSLFHPEGEYLKSLILQLQ